jgi:hypothetical protein
MDWITAIAEAIKAVFGFAAKVTPSEKVQDDLHEIKKPRLEQKQKIAIYDREFRRLKDHTEIPVPLDINFVDDNLNEDDKKELIELLTKRITEYRLKHPVIFHKWLKQNNLI